MRLLAAAALSAAAAGCLQAPPSARPDGGDGDADGGPAEPCGTAAALSGDFAGGDLDGNLWDTFGGAEMTANAVLMSTAAGFASLSSNAYYLVSGSQVVAQVDLTAAADARFAMELESADGYLASMVVEGGSLRLRLVDGNGARSLGEAAYDPALTWWRLREERGAFYWAASSNPEDWDEQGPFPAAIGEIARVDFELTAGALEGSVSVQAVNPDPAVAYCPAASFTDGFDTLSGPWWHEEVQGDCEVSLDGQAVLGYSTQAFCALTARQRFDLRDSSFAVELVEVGDCRPEPIMLVTLAGGDELAILCRDEGGVRKLVAANYTGVGDVSVINYDPALHRFVRLRHDSATGNVEFEALDDAGVGWVPFGSLLVAPAGLAHTGLRFYLGDEPTTTGVFESVSFDSLNLAPL